MRNVPPEYFEVSLLRNHNRDSTTVDVYSRVLDIRFRFDLRRQWGDPRRLVDFIEQFIGGTVRAWYEARVGTGRCREMAQALLPHWAAEIHRQMERLEYEDRNHHHRYDAMRYAGYEALRINPTWMDWAAPAEDPKAKEKARQLLMRNLDAGQLKSFKKDGSFRVTAQDGKAYTISTARSFNVKAEDGTLYCGQLSDTPVEDQMLAQKLLLEHEPEKFFKNANVSTGSGGGEWAACIGWRSSRQHRMGMNAQSAPQGGRS